MNAGMGEAIRRHAANHPGGPLPAATIRTHAEAFGGPLIDAVRTYATAAAEPNPFYLCGPAADQPPEPMPQHDKMRLRAAAYRATRIYPGPVGQLISQELLSWHDFGFHIGPGLVRQLVDHCLKTEPAAPTR